MPSNSKPRRQARKGTPLARRIGALKRERAQLEEEVLQLKAAVNIWTEVCRQTVTVAKSETSMEIG